MGILKRKPMVDLDLYATNIPEAMDRTAPEPEPMVVVYQPYWEVSAHINGGNVVAWELDTREEAETHRSCFKGSNPWIEAYDVTLRADNVLYVRINERRRQISVKRSEVGSLEIVNTDTDWYP